MNCSLESNHTSDLPRNGFYANFKLLPLKTKNETTQEELAFYQI